MARLFNAVLLASTIGFACPAVADGDVAKAKGATPATIGCEMDGAELDCTGNGQDDAARTEALASTVTFAVLRKQLERPDFRKTAAKREIFRRSLERNRAAAQRVANRAERAYRRKRLSKAEFKATQDENRAALRNYRAGMLVYDTGIWNDVAGSERVGD